MLEHPTIPPTSTPIIPLSKLIVLSAVLFIWTPEAAADEHRFVALESQASGKYVSASYDNGNGALLVNADEAHEWETFLLIERTDGTIRLRCLEGDYIKANGGGGSNTLKDVINTTGTYVTYTPIDAGAGLVAFETHNGHFLRVGYSSVEDDDVLWADSPAVGTDPGTVFRIVDLEAAPKPAARTFVSVRSSRLDPNPPDPTKPDYQYVTAELGSEYPDLRTTVTEVAPWETFLLIDMGDGTARLQARNGEYLKAKNSGGSITMVGPITGAGSAATFELVRGLPHLGPNEVLLRTSKNFYLTINSSGLMKATAAGYQDEGVFKLESLEDLPRERTWNVTIQSVTTGQYLNNLGGPAFEDAPRRVEGTFVMNEYASGKGAFTSFDGKQLKVVDGGGSTTWFASGWGDYARYEVIRGLPELAEDEVVLRTDNGHYLNADGQGGLVATAGSYQDSAVFKIEKEVPEVPQALKIALRSRDLDDNSNTPYLSEHGYFSISIGGGETFTMLEYIGGDLMIQNSDGEYLSAVGGGGGALDWIETDEPGGFETFSKQSLGIAEEHGTESVRIIADDGNHCLTGTMDANWYQVLGFMNTCSGASTEFDIIYIDEFPVYTLVAIKSVSNGKYMAAEGGSLFPDVYANRSTIGSWEKYMMTTGPDRFFTLMTNHGTYVRAPTGQTGELNCGSTGVSYRENAILIHKGNDEYGIKTKNTGNYWRVASSGLIDMIGNPANADARFNVIELDVLGRASDLVSGSNLVIPVAGGTGSIVLPNVADLNITETPWGTLESITATAELPLFPGALGALSTMGAMQGGIRVNVAYATGDTINNAMSDVVFPLNPIEKYFYLSYAQGASSDWNGISLEAPGSGQIQLAIDHRTPTVFMYTDLPIFGGVLDSGGFGVSARSNIPFAPERAEIYTPDGNTTFLTDFWATGEIPIPGLELENVGLSVDAEVAMKFRPGALTNIDELPADALEFLGANGVLIASINPFDWATVWEAELGDASLIVNNEDTNNPWISFNGELGYNDNYIRLPLGLKIPNNNKNKVTVDAHLNSNASESYITVAADVGEFSNYTGNNALRLTGEFTANSSGLDFSGQAKFGTRRVAVSGYVTGSSTHIEGEFEEKISGKVNMGFYKLRWSVEFTITPSFTFGDQNNVQLQASARACVGGSCDSISADVEILSSGRVRLCADLPVVGDKCDTF